MYKLQPRANPCAYWVWLSPLLAALLTVVTAAVLALIYGFNPFALLHAFFVAPLDDLYGIGEWCLKAAPLALIAAGLSIGFRANVWNIGAEGQLIVGALAASGVALAYGTSADSAWLLPTMALAGVLGGMAWAMIPALLKSRFNTNEILVSLMLVYVASLLLSWLIHGPLRDPMGFGFPQSALFENAALMPTLIPGTRLHIGALLPLLVLPAYAVFSRWSFMAFQMRVSGLAPRAAEYAGYSRSRNTWVGLLAGGAAAGVAGMMEVSGPIGQLVDPVSPGYGFTAIIVAFVGRLNAVGIAIASLVMALLYLGGESAQMVLDLPAAVSGVFQGLLLFYVLAADVFIHYRLVPNSRSPREKT